MWIASTQGTPLPPPPPTDPPCTKLHDSAQTLHFGGHRDTPQGGPRRGSPGGGYRDPLLFNLPHEKYSRRGKLSGIPFHFLFRLSYEYSSYNILLLFQLTFRFPMSVATTHACSCSQRARSTICVRYDKLRNYDIKTRSYIHLRMHCHSV